MSRDPGACLICGEPLRYFTEEREMTCSLCGRSFPSRAACAAGHYVCDDCHAARGVEVILDHCRNSASKDPVAMAQAIMDDPFIYMHGNEHHILVGAVLLTAYRNAGGQLELEPALQEMKRRGSAYPGGSCGFWGACGAAVSAGMFLSIATGATPLSGKSWAMANDITSKCLADIAALGGPRCCKRNSFTAIRAATEYVRAHLGVEMDLPGQIVCRWSPENQQCIRKACPYYPGQPR